MSERISMRKIKEVLRLRWDVARTYREISRSVSVNTNTISECIKRAKRAGLTWLFPNDSLLVIVDSVNFIEDDIKTLMSVCVYLTKRGKSYSLILLDLRDLLLLTK